MTDCYKVRRVGFWNFESLQGQLDRMEDLRVARELAGKGEEQLEDKDAAKRKYFDPIKEHLSWNPLVLADDDGMVGWEVVQGMFVWDSHSDGGQDSDRDRE